MNYEEMSDFEINKEVAIRNGFLVEQEPSMNGAVFHYFDIHNTEGFHKNYCSEPADAWPIIFKNKIDIYFHPIADKWISSICAFNGFDDFDDCHEFNPP